jgi:hypothetical protein
MTVMDRITKALLDGYPKGVTVSSSRALAVERAIDGDLFSTFLESGNENSGGSPQIGKVATQAQPVTAIKKGAFGFRPLLPFGCGGWI